jgi:hypothetical protein
VEVFIFLGLLIALAVMAPRYGVDSREGTRTKESELGARGVTWTDLPHR